MNDPHNPKFPWQPGALDRRVHYAVAKADLSVWMFTTWEIDVRPEQRVSATATLRQIKPVPSAGGKTHTFPFIEENYYPAELGEDGAPIYIAESK